MGSEGRSASEAVDWEGLARSLTDDPEARGRVIARGLEAAAGSLARALGDLLTAAPPDCWRTGATLVVAALTRSADEPLRASAEAYGRARAWPLVERLRPPADPCSLVIAVEGPVRGLAAMDDTALVITGDGALAAYSLRTTARRWRAAGRGDRLLLAPRGERCLRWGDGPEITARASGDGATVGVFAHEGPVVAAALSPDEGSLVAATAEGTVRVWTGLDPRRWRDFTASSAGLTAAAVVAEGVLLGFEDGHVELRGIADGALAGRWRLGFPDAVREIAADEGGAIAVVSEGVREITPDITSQPEPVQGRWRTPLSLARGFTWAEPRDESGERARWGARWLRAEGELTTVGEGFDEREVLIGHRGAVVRAAFLDAATVLTAGEDETLRRWSLGSAGRRTRDEPFGRIALLEDGRTVRVESSHYGARRWREGGAVLAERAVTRDGRTHPEDGTATFLGGREVFTVRGEGGACGSDAEYGELSAVALDEDGRGWLGCGLRHRIAVTDGDDPAETWIDGLTGSLMRLVEHPDGRRIIGLNHDGQLFVWDRARRAMIARHRLGAYREDFAVVADGEHVVAVGPRGHAVFSLATGEATPAVRPSEPRSGLRGFAFDRAGTRRASVSPLGGLMVTGTLDGRSEGAGIAVAPGARGPLAFLADDTLLLADGPVIRRYDLARGAVRTTSETGGAAPSSLHPLADGRRWVSCAPSEVRVWEIASGSCLHVLAVPGECWWGDPQLLDDGTLALPRAGVFDLTDGRRVRAFDAMALVTRDGRSTLRATSQRALLEVATGARQLPAPGDLRELRAYLASARRAVYARQGGGLAVLSLDDGTSAPWADGRVPEARERRHGRDPWVSLDATERSLWIGSPTERSSRRVALPPGEHRPRLLRVAGDGRRAALCLTPSAVTLLDPLTGAIERTLDAGEPLSDLDLSADGRCLVTLGAARVRWWSVDTGAPFAEAAAHPAMRGVVLTEGRDAVIADAYCGVTTLRVLPGG